MKNTFKWMFAAILICGLAVSSCKKDPQPTPAPDPDPEPITQTVLTGIVGTGVLTYGNVTYSFEYDSDYRVTRSLFYQTDDNTVNLDLHFTYSESHISAECHATGKTYECTLDDEGRITHYVRTRDINDTIHDITTADFTYDAEGHLISKYTISNAPDAQGATVDFVWEGDELKERNTEDGLITDEFETSEAPAQVMLDKFGFDTELSALSAQGCFGKLPAHMPSKSTKATHIAGVPFIVRVDEFTYTFDANGRLATMVEMYGASDDNLTANYTFNWEER